MLPMQKGIAWFLFSRFSFALAAAVVKFFPYSAMQFNFVRGVFVCLAVFPLLWFRRGIKAFISKSPILMTSRIICASVGLMCFYYTFQTMPFAKAITIGATQTFLTPVFAKIFLKEQVGFRRWAAIIIGYIGIWFALDPVYSGIDFPEIIALVNVVLTAASNTMSKRLVSKDSPQLLMFYAGVASIALVGVLWMSESYWTSIVHMDPWPIMQMTGFVMMLFLMGPLAFCGQFGYLKAYTYTDLSLLVPYEYSSFIFATVIGYVIFQEVPETTTLVAMTFIIFATTLLTASEMKRPIK